ncbi:hypothetical protein ATO13_23296 [Stappia sp. 22II-S9-Z10]|nr:hypothetical protein ATO13_23296 [Stappia sp. 22II-S9-Z10]
MTNRYYQNGCSYPVPHSDEPGTYEYVLRLAKLVQRLERTAVQCSGETPIDSFVAEMEGGKGNPTSAVRWENAAQRKREDTTRLKPAAWLITRRVDGARRVALSPLPTEFGSTSSCACGQNETAVPLYTATPPDQVNVRLPDGLRDQFAMAALNGMLSHSTRYRPRDEHRHMSWHDAIATEAYQIADAMLAARKAAE